MEKLFAKQHTFGKLLVWICLTGRSLVKRADGTHRIVPR